MLASWDKWYIRNLGRASGQSVQFEERQGVEVWTALGKTKPPIIILGDDKCPCNDKADASARQAAAARPLKLRACFLGDPECSAAKAFNE